MVIAKRIQRRSFSCLMLVLVTLSACGQKRALYLPEEPAKNTQTAKPTTKSPDEGKD